MPTGREFGGELVRHGQSQKKRKKRKEKGKSPDPGKHNKCFGLIQSAFYRVHHLRAGISPALEALLPFPFHFST
jgi:hypothetical protein